MAVSPTKSRFSDDERLKRLPELADIRSRRAKAAHNRRLIGPNLQDIPSVEVLEKLAILAAIAHVPPKKGGTPNAGFNARIIGHVLMAHTVAGISSVKKMAAHKNGAHHARELVKYLKTDGKRLSFFLLRFETVDDYIESIDSLAQEAQIVARLAKATRPGGAMTLTRKYFVEGLLNIVVGAGGRLTLSRAKESGSLFDIKLLEAHLPKDISGKLSFSTLRRVYDPWLRAARRKYPWLKNEKNSSKKA
jgi:hypothetical protein